MQYLLLLWALLRTSAYAADLRGDFNEANRLYETGKYSEAAAAYQKIINAGSASPALYYNLGNAWFKTGQIGKAIVNYRLAERLSPRDPDIRANLSFARNQVASANTAQARESWWERAVRRLSLNEWTVWTMVFTWALVLLLAVAQLRPAWADACKSYAYVFVLATAFCGIGLALSYRQQFVSRDAVVIAPECIARYGPLDKSPSFFTLSSGAEVSVLDQLNGWAQVADAGDRHGWVLENAINILGETKKARQ